jgi:N-acetylmuramic acid 6-phosphate etherase
MADRGHLATELRNPRSADFDRMSIADAVRLMNAEDAVVPAAVAAASAEVVRAVELVVAAFRGGGRLIYVGAGTSGRLGVLDASECPPTFLSPPDMVQGVIAGGWDALRRSIEGAEDSPDDGAAAMDERDVGPRDVAFGICAGGTTPFVRGALERARQRGAKTVFFACVSPQAAPDDADVSIRVLVGPEVLTGSTRLKAATATKLVLNTITTVAMARIGKVYENLMVDVNTRANAKLVDRGARIIRELTGVSREAALDLLARTDGRVKVAVVMRLAGVERSVAEARLAESNGSLRAALEHA